MNLLGVLDISGSALTAERQRAEVLASNLANAQTTQTAKGGPYRRQMVVFKAQSAGNNRFASVLSGFSDRYAQGVEVTRVVADPTPPVQRYEPGHPDADSQGYVSYPDINPIEEMVNLMGAARSYEVNIAAVQATKNMISASLEILS
ncbi:MAG: flagellar basal body rod protein FlgC [Terriglobia bacterium]|jgi:flagellar basal-body rod protein FlgC